MERYQATEIEAEGNAATLYDRFARLYNITFKFNGYGRSIERYFETNPLPLPAGAQVLDVGCGTGLLTYALLKTLRRPSRITSVDLSLSSLQTARRGLRTEQPSRVRHETAFAQANLLSLPFADQTFDLVVTSGALEYVPLPESFAELARVIAPGGYLFHLPVIPLPFSRVLELLFRFKTHPTEAVLASTRQHFRLLDEYRFPFPDPIGWTKMALLSQKI